MGLEPKGARRHADAMVEFDLQLLGDPRLFGLIAAHGFPPVLLENIHIGIISLKLL